MDPLERFANARLRDYRHRIGPLAEALAVIRWDLSLIEAKLRRALYGQDDDRRGESCDDDPVQNDWNGSAKVALISIQRSVAAWNVVAEEWNEAQARVVARELAIVEGRSPSLFSGGLALSASRVRWPVDGPG